MLTVKQFAAKIGMDEGNLRRLLKAGRIKGARKWGRDWQIPQNAVKPADRRFKLPKATDAAL